MPRRSSILDLPDTLREELDRRLIAAGFSGYEKLEEWLAEAGHPRGKTTIWRYGSAFEERCKSLKLVTDQARAIVKESPDDEGVVGEALTRLLQEKLFSVLMDLQVDPEQVDIHKLGRVIGDLARASVSQKKWAAEARKAAMDDVRSRIDGLEKSAAKRKLDPETLRAIREEVYGLS